jgi:hypothetical protein
MNETCIWGTGGLIPTGKNLSSKDVTTRCVRTTFHEKSVWGVFKTQNSLAFCAKTNDPRRWPPVAAHCCPCSPRDTAISSASQSCAWYVHDFAGDLMGRIASWSERVVTVDTILRTFSCVYVCSLILYQQITVRPGVWGSCKQCLR